MINAAENVLGCVCCHTMIAVEVTLVTDCYDPYRVFSC